MKLAALALLGAFCWTFAEYVLHRFAGHGGRGRHALSREHLAHHARPEYFSPAWKKLLMVVPVLGALFGALTPLASPAAAGALTAGFDAGWLAYEALHRALHVWPPRHAYGRWARRHHFAHHFQQPKANHGVTTPLWDVVFRTHQPVAVVRVPRKLAPQLPWLERVTTGEFVVV